MLDLEDEQLELGDLWSESMTRLTIDQFTAFFRWYKGLPHQDLAIAELWRRIPVSLLEDDAD